VSVGGRGVALGGTVLDVGLGLSARRVGLGCGVSVAVSTAVGVAVGFGTGVGLGVAVTLLLEEGVSKPVGESFIPPSELEAVPFGAGTSWVVEPHPTNKNSSTIRMATASIFAIDVFCKGNLLVVGCELWNLIKIRHSKTRFQLQVSR
jgi:hypothetical protein